MVMIIGLLEVIIDWVVDIVEFILFRVDLILVKVFWLSVEEECFRDF